MFRYCLAGTKTSDREKLVTARQKTNSSEFLTQISITSKKYVVDRFIYSHCLKFVPMKAT